jgi:hypothetical protein
LPPQGASPRQELCRGEASANGPPLGNTATSTAPSGRELDDDPQEVARNNAVQKIAIFFIEISFGNLPMAYSIIGFLSMVGATKQRG